MTTRTTLSLDGDLSERLEVLAKQRRLTFKQVVNLTLRRGLEPEAPAPEPFDFQAHAGGMLPNIDPRRLNELAWDLDEDRLQQ